MLPSKKVRRRMGDFKISHHVLNIQNRVNGLVNGDALETAATKGLHIVRGHFSTYTEKAPLFGRQVGRFWVPAHVRGDISSGIITSEYMVSSNKAGLVTAG